ncbi:hypothetical protein [Nocardioides sp. W7]|uniref:hypothetical protein n=1 Tax=Nocardioides sp. W7 TaxID=2931390 RepID=UPI001FD46492|nr:hypothetical protein [Nocardioides sp. W7]
MLEALITFLIVKVGPEPSPPAISSDVFAAHLAATLLEPRDRVVLVGWWLSVPMLLGLVWVLARLRRGPARLFVDVLALAGAVVLAVAAALWFEEVDPGLAAWFPRLQWWELVLGVLAAVLAVASLLVRGVWFRRVASVVLVVVILAFLLPALVQTPTSIVEPWHATYTLDELIAPAVGRVPLVDYFPQYVNLLGLPIAPVIRSSPDHALAIALGWVLFLQVVTIAGAVLVGAMVGGRRTVPVVLLLVSAPIIFATANGVYPATYFASVPFRTVLPVVTIVAALALFRRSAGLGTRGVAWRAAVVGLLAGVAALNNPDHGLPVVVAVGVGIVLALTGWRDRVVAAVVGGVAVALPFLVYATVTALIGESADWSKFLLFSQMFGTIGYGNVAMPAFGTHVGVVAFFAAATVVGILLQVRRRDSDTWRIQGLALTLCGGWSLLTLPYYMGRSLPTQLLFGYAVQVGLVSAALVPLFLHVVKRMASGDVRVTAAGATSVALTLLALGSVAGSLWSAPTPAASFDRLEAAEVVGPSNLPQDTPAVQAALQDPANGDLRRLDAQGLLGQVVGSPSVVELTTGVPNVTVTNQPTYLAIAVGMLRLQCQVMADQTVTAVIMADWVAANLNAVEDCCSVFVVESAYRPVAPGFVVVEVRAAGVPTP